jgi:hypothetical protein
VTRCAALGYRNDRKSLLRLEFRSPAGLLCRAAGHYPVTRTRFRLQFHPFTLEE